MKLVWVLAILFSSGLYGQPTPKETIDARLYNNILNGTDYNTLIREVMDREKETRALTDLIRSEYASLLRLSEDQGKLIEELRAQMTVVLTSNYQTRGSAEATTKLNASVEEVNRRLESLEQSRDTLNSNMSRLLWGFLSAFMIWLVKEIWHLKTSKHFLGVEQVRQMVHDSIIQREAERREETDAAIFRESQATRNQSGRPPSKLHNR